ncbi:MAG: transglutaminase domain-containing protein [Ferruginibacter sp.]
MKKIILSFLIILIVNNLKAQQPDPALAAVDEYVQKLGALEKFNVATIADTITRKFSDKKEKARAIFYWIANNIALNPKAIKSNDNKNNEPENVIQLRKTTALGFATLVQEMCSLANIRCLVVDGYIKSSAMDIGEKADDINHSWNVVQLGQSPDKWYYIDAARASGYLDGKMSVFTKQFTSEYFFADKKLFNLDHYPDNKGWYLGDDQKSLKEFYALPVIGYMAYSFGLQKPMPLTGHIKIKVGTTVSFSFSYNPYKTISSISLVMGEEKKQSKPEPMNFTDNGGSVRFTYKFKKADSCPLKVVVDGKDLLIYNIDVED